MDESAKGAASVIRTRTQLNTARSALVASYRARMTTDAKISVREVLHQVGRFLILVDIPFPTTREDASANVQRVAEDEG